LPTIDEMKEKLDQDDKEQAAAKTEAAKKFDPKALAESTRKIQVLDDPDLGEIRYGLLTDEEVRSLHLAEISDDGEKAARVIHAMLQKADPTFSYEDFKALPFDVKGVLTVVMAGTFSRFLRIQQRLGLQPAPKPKSPDS
jgi:hypothetical protein